MNTDQSFLGNGWSFPISFQQTGDVEMASEEADIRQSLQILLGTRQGERVMQPRYGCNLDVLLFEPLTTSMLAYVKDLIQTAILYYEPRIELNTIKITQVDELTGLLLISLDYTILSTNSRYNLVYPFYLNEGTIK
ncbi:hypothetical protein SAMN05660909_02047 [Chitinophaga terrae (ex Kim and Jung 2007)]|jgi:phage baseplate assembly protein W|uniref:IraD/Gp25-like domain-containing protein n=1 Tax=Chitinophaga terrae (ex Kim and Jung 2007) TaxID=408074 RepID=A0A1H4BCA1_9BACT|nr:GPW/gp25 family protein [Chitinophaga terrae (ex Kim and Jung 2007)]MDQ0106212.1 phage baseplate assembly protein W [Chitinophaga terrae (ex Kim and Jung 2007)]GEP92148.1 baseplate protein [Chitinophaga terrae (ex Kim and Jung 2007)]SEA45803.1 hypothetical protein SAMN05660909_02047 [Chitinophaga terrae (ex Kim and Jung 2007)]